MKKILYFMLAATIAIVGCDKEKSEDGNKPGNGNTEYPAPTPNTAYKIECSNAIEGKVWNAGDAIGLFSSTAGVTASNVMCTLDQPGGQTGTFTTPKLNLVAGKNDFVAYSPYSAEVFAYNNVIYNLTIAKNQTVKAGEVPSLFSWGKFTAIPVVEETFKATIAPLAAIAKVSVSTSELAGFKVNSIQVTDLSGEAELGGAYNLDVASGTLTSNEKFTLVTATVAFSTALEADQVQDFYIQLKPGEYAGLYISINLSKEEEVDGEVVKEEHTLILKRTSLQLSAGEVTVVQAAGLTSTTNEADWYASDDTRLFPEGAWGYGQANTFLIQCKNGSTYTNATYTPDASIPDEVTIDIRARGNLSKVQDPKGATFEWYQFNGKTYVPRTQDYLSSNIDPTQFTFDYDGEYTVRVRNTGAFAGAPILVMKKGGKILWSWTFWNVAADGTKLEAVDVQGTPYKIANMDIGQATTQFSTWTKNMNSSTSAAGPDLVFRTTCFYQHGRPIPTFWTSFWSVNTNVPVIYGPLSLDEAIANPVGQILKETPGENMGPWLKEIQQHIWGGSDKNDGTVAEKTVYDPCPQGWQVPPPAVAEALAEDTPTAHDMTGAVGVKFPKTGEVVFLTTGYINGKIDTNGRLQSMGGGQAGTASACKYGILWTSMCGADQGHALYLNNSVAGLSSTRKGTFNRTISAPVRCIKELN